MIIEMLTYSVADWKPWEAYSEYYPAGSVRWSTLVTNTCRDRVGEGEFDSDAATTEISVYLKRDTEAIWLFRCVRKSGPLYSHTKQSLDTGCPKKEAWLWTRQRSAGKKISKKTEG